MNVERSTHHKALCLPYAEEYSENYDDDHSKHNSKQDGAGTGDRVIAPYQSILDREVPDHAKAEGGEAKGYDNRTHWPGPGLECCVVSGRGDGEELYKSCVIPVS